MGIKMTIQCLQSMSGLRGRVSDAPKDYHDSKCPMLELFLEQEQKSLIYHALQDLRAHTLIHYGVSENPGYRCQWGRTWYQPSKPSFLNTL